MDKTVSIAGEKITLNSMTKEYWHTYYENYVPDPMMDSTPYVYDKDNAEKSYFARVSDPTRLYFSIMLDNNVIGNIYLKHIDESKMRADFGIALTNDSVKGKGYGTEAVKLLLNYAFRSLGLNSITADSVLRNARSQHMLEKLGFNYTHEDSVFKYYIIEKNGMY